MAHPCEEGGGGRLVFQYVLKRILRNEHFFASFTIYIISHSLLALPFTTIMETDGYAVFFHIHGWDKITFFCNKSESIFPTHNAGTNYFFQLTAEPNFIF